MLFSKFFLIRLLMNCLFVFIGFMVWEDEGLIFILNMLNRLIMIIFLIR